MANPSIIVNQDKIEHNARKVSEIARDYGIQIMGVTKGTCALPEVARAMLSGGTSGLGDSRIQNIERLRQAGIDSHITLLRSPMPHEALRVVRLANRSLVSSTSALKELDRCATEESTQHEVVLMVDLGDLREGFWPRRETWNEPDQDVIYDAVRTALDMRAIRLTGIGVNLACFGAVIPTREKMLELIEIAEDVRKSAALEQLVVSGGNSANIGLLLRGEMPSGVSELRIGEAILLGTDPVSRTPIAGCFQDAFTLVTEVIEVHTKPSLPIGQQGVDAFGGKPEFCDRGPRRRAILALGRQDIDWEDITPNSPGIDVLGASSDHLVVDVHEAPWRVEVGDSIQFDVGYAAMLRACTSAYVSKQVFTGGV